MCYNHYICLSPGHFLRKMPGELFLSISSMIIGSSNCLVPLYTNDYLIQYQPRSVMYMALLDFSELTHAVIILCMRSANETTLHCNIVSHWLGAYKKWSLLIVTHCCHMSSGSNAKLLSIRPRNKLQWNLFQNTRVCIQGNAFENVICKILAIVFKLQYVNRLKPDQI